MTDETAPERDAGFDDWLDALAAGDGYSLVCPDGHATLPPAQACQACGARDLSRRTLASTGSIVSYTVVHVATPAFEDDAPYVTAIAEFDRVRLTGLLRGIDPSSCETGLKVRANVEETGTTGERVVTFRPVE